MFFYLVGDDVQRDARVRFRDLAQEREEFLVAVAALGSIRPGAGGPGAVRPRMPVIPAMPVMPPRHRVTPGGTRRPGSPP
jgi:hypothetical protein